MRRPGELAGGELAGPALIALWESLGWLGVTLIAVAVVLIVAWGLFAWWAGRID